MMPSLQDFANKCAELEGKYIPYVLGAESLTGMDCQGLVKWALKQLGIKAEFRGTNDLWRNYLNDKGLIPEYVPIGSLLFIWEPTGEPDRYLGDRLGNFNHVYVKIREGTLIHASASNAKVTTRAFADKEIKNGGPNRWGIYKAFNLTDDPGAKGEDGIELPEIKNIFKPKYSGLRWKIGDTGNGVREVQNGLFLLGYPVKIDGQFGPITDQYVRVFQANNNLLVDGVVGSKTWKALIEKVHERIT